MSPYRIMVTARKDALDAARPLLNREGLTVSGFFQRSVNEYLDAHKNRNRVINLDDVEVLR